MQAHEAHEAMESLASGFALGVLEPEEASAFAEHMPSCPRCQHLLAETRAVVESLPMAVEQVNPPATLKARVLAAVHGETPLSSEATGPSAARAPLTPVPVWRRWLFQPAGASAIVLVLMAGLIGTGTWAYSLQNRLEASQARLSGLYGAVTILAEADQRWEFSGSPIEPGANGLLAYSSEAQSAMLIVWGLTEQAEGKTYVAWTAADGARQGVGPMRRTNGGLWQLVDGDIAGMEAVGITLRDEAAPEGQQLTDVIVVPVGGR